MDPKVREQNARMPELLKGNKISASKMKAAREVAIKTFGKARRLSESTMTERPRKEPLAPNE
jgi:hypothetical protein